MMSTGNFMTLGGQRKERRCENKPAYIVKELKPGPDGRKGSMSVCMECEPACTRMMGDKVKFFEIKNRQDAAEEGGR